MSSPTRATDFAAACARAARSTPPLVPRARRSRAATALELEDGRRDGLEEPAVVRHEHDRCVERRQLPLQPLEALHVEVVGRARRAAAGRDRRRARAPARPGSALRPRTWRAGGRDRHRGSRGRGGPTAARSRQPQPPGVLEPCLGLAVAAQASTASWAPAAIACSRPCSSCSMRTRSAAPEREYSRSDSPRSRGGRWSCSATRAPFCKRELAALQRRLADDRPQKRRLAGAVLAREGEPLPADRPRTRRRRTGDLRRAPCGGSMRSGRPFGAEA